MDEVYRHNGNTHVSGGTTAFDSGTSDQFELAPALEYSWTPNVGVLLGVRLIPAGRNASATVTPVTAINIVI